MIYVFIIIVSIFHLWIGSSFSKEVMLDNKENWYIKDMLLFTFYCLIWPLLLIGGLIIGGIVTIFEKIFCDTNFIWKWKEDSDKTINSENK